MIKDLEGESWKPINGFVGFYEVSDKSRVKRVPGWVNARIGRKFIPESLVRPILAKHGYLMVHLSGNGTRKKMYLHRLVSENFIDNYFGLPAVNHINSVRHDCRLENLEWVTYQENSLHGFRVGSHKPIRGDDHRNSKLSSCVVRNVKHLLKSNRIATVSRMLGIKYGTVYSIAIGKSWAHVE